MMFRAFLFIVLILVGQLKANPVPVPLLLSDIGGRQNYGVIGVDNRQRVDFRDAFARYVGKLWTPSGICTATLVAPNYILTAAHCLTPNQPTNNRFYLQETSTASAGNSRTIKYFTPAALNVDSDRLRRRALAALVLGVPIEQVLADVMAGNLHGRNDWALLLLQNDLSEHYLSSGSYSTQRSVHSIGYGNSGRSDGHPSWHRNCPRVRNEWRLAPAGMALTECDIVKGSSGGPLYDQNNHLVGVHSMTSGQHSYHVSSSESRRFLDRIQRYDRTYRRVLHKWYTANRLYREQEATWGNSELANEVRRRFTTSLGNVRRLHRGRSLGNYPQSIGNELGLQDRLWRYQEQKIAQMNELQSDLTPLIIRLQR